ncbi:Yip1 member 6 [Boothiomyces sp. JEL0866]|nr:Yip1 member 6 [Boothiomyces sp. JEL0866]
MAGKYTQLQEPELEYSHTIDISNVQGNIGGGTAQTEQPKMENTLDEPIKVTIMRDVTNIWNKIRHVLDPRQTNKQNLLRDWDWWGPLLLCLALSVSFYQSVCVLGYCIFPLVAVSMFTWAIPYIIKFVCVTVAYVWATYASLNFLTDMNLDNKRLLAIYPIFLFYFMISWLILISE